MAFNLNSLKGLFSKLKPAAKTIANYGDDAANALTTYGDDVAKMAFANADDLAAATAQTGDIAKLISDADVPTDTPSHMWVNGASNAPEQFPYWSPNYKDSPLPSQVLVSDWHYDTGPWSSPKLEQLYADSVYSDDVLKDMARDHIQNVYDTQTVPVGMFTEPENTDELISHLNNADAELDSLSQLDPDAYKSTMTNAPAFRKTIAPEEFGGYGGYDNRLVGSFQYPDGFINPDSAAMYYDSLERGYVPMEYAKASNRIHDDWALSDSKRHAYGEPGLYDLLRRRLGPAAFTSPNKSEQFLQNLIDQGRLIRRRR